MANAGNVIFFVLTLAGTAIVTSYILVYLARCILVVVAGTAIGQEPLLWPDELFVDWIGEVVALASVILFCMIPAGFLSNALRDDWLVELPGLRTFFLCVLSLWLFFPVGCLSSLSSVSRWVFFRPLIVTQLVLLLPATLLFYFLSVLLLYVGLAPLGWVLIEAHPLFLVPAVPFAAAAILIYARLLGRLGAMIRARIPFLPDKPVRKKPANKVKKGPPFQSTPDVDTPYVGEADHVYSPEVKNRPVIFEEDGDVTEAYGLGNSTPVPQPEPEPVRPKRTRPLDPEEEDAQRGYQIDQPGTPSGIFTPGHDRWQKRPKASEKLGKPKLRKKKPPPPPGLDSFFRGVFTLPLTHSCVVPWLSLSIGLGLASGLFILCRSLLPT